MLKRRDLGRIISERFTLRAGKPIPIYLGDWMVDYVFEAIKIALIEDGDVDIRNHVRIRRNDIPAHEKRLPNGNVVTIPYRAELNIQFKENFLNDVTNGNYVEFKEQK